MSKNLEKLCRQADKMIGASTILSGNSRVLELQQRGYTDLAGKPVANPVTLLEGFLHSLEREQQETLAERERLRKDAVVTHGRSAAD